MRAGGGNNAFDVKSFPRSPEYKKSLPGQTGKGLWVVVVLWNLLAAGIWQILISCRQTPPPHSTVLNQDS